MRLTGDLGLLDVFHHKLLHNVAGGDNRADFIWWSELFNFYYIFLEVQTRMDKNGIKRDKVENTETQCDLYSCP